MQVRDRLEQAALLLPVPARRLGYRLAHPLLLLAWILTGHVRPGVKCLILRGEEVLLVRHTYGSRRWELPGGTLAAGETPFEAAAREMHEELGVELSDLRVLGRRELAAAPRARGTITYVSGDLVGSLVHPDAAEIADARFQVRSHLPEPLGQRVRTELALLDA